MEHRRLLADPDAQRGFRSPAFFERFGGRAAVDTLVDHLYDGIERDRPLRRLFGRRLDAEREGQKRFFTEWLGGQPVYSQRAYLPLLHRHDLLPITEALAERWLGHFLDALELAVADPVAREQAALKTRQLAMALVNEHGDKAAAVRQQSHGTCLRYRPAIDALALARRGDADALDAAVTRDPEILGSISTRASLLHIAALGGRTRVVEVLLEHGVDANLPEAIQALIYVTPLCAARAKRHPDVERLLLGNGAREDVFTHAYLGDEIALARALHDAHELAQAVDPAVDALQVTPVHHAVAGNHARALQVVLEHVQGEIVNGARALALAVALTSVEMTRALLARGVDARAIGPGRWVMHPELAPLLTGAGADAGAGQSGAWIGLSCTGNQGRKDDPDFVAALLRHGARADDRRLVGQDADGGRATALHYAAKAGFLGTIEVLLRNGADPRATDDNGRTPFDWLERSTKSVDRAAVRRLLSSSR